MSVIHRQDHLQDNLEFILQLNGFRRNCKDWHEYKRAKQVVIGNEWLANYDTIIRIITRYLGL